MTDPYACPGCDLQLIAHRARACAATGLSPECFERDPTFGTYERRQPFPRRRETIWRWMRANNLAGYDHPPSFPQIAQATGASSHGTIVAALKRDTETTGAKA